MEESDELNVGYILSLQSINGELVVKEIPIDYSDDIISVLDKLNGYISNEQVFNAFDVEKFVKQCSFEKKLIIGYCWPNEYNASFISHARILEIDKEKYYKEMDEIKKDLFDKYEKKKNCSRWIDGHYECLSDYEKDQLEKEKWQKIEEEQAKYERIRLQNYVDEVRRYIFALQYWKTLQSIKDSSLMYSSENIGWYKPYFNITGNARIGLRSNFCYGRSAYFDVLLNYKGINILPYSDLVNYYWSNMMDNLRCTRSYSIYRSNWTEVLRFVAELCNWIERDSDSFEKKWIIDEVESMMEGLKNIKINIESYYKKLKDDKDEFVRLQKTTSKSQTIRYRWINDRITNQYKTYPYETTLIIQVDKLSAALSLLEELSSLKNIYSPVTTHIHTILQYNRALLPAIKTECKKLAAEIKDNQSLLKQIETDIESNEKKLVVKKDEISATLDVTNKEYSNSSPEVRQSILANASVNDSEYLEIENEITDLRKRLAQINQDIHERESFKSILEIRKGYIVDCLKQWKE